MAWAGGVPQCEDHILTIQGALVAFDVRNNFLWRAANEPIGCDSRERPLGI